MAGRSLLNYFDLLGILDHDFRPLWTLAFLNFVAPARSRKSFEGASAADARKLQKLLASEIFACYYQLSN